MATRPVSDPTLSMVRLLDPAFHADPHLLYNRLREEDPVYWDPYLHTWVVTRYQDVLTVLHHFSADRTPSPDTMRQLGLGEIEPISAVMVRQMLFRDPPDHTILRKLCSTAFTPRRVDALESRVQSVANRLVDDAIEKVRGGGCFDILTDFAEPFPAIVFAHLMGVPEEHYLQLKAWTADYAEMLGNFQHNPEGVAKVLDTTEAMVAYFRDAIRSGGLADGLLKSLVEAEVDGARLSEDEVIANAIVTMVGGQETTTNLIASGMLTLFHQPDKLAQLRDRPEITESAIEELLRYETPSQHTARICREDMLMGGKVIKKGAAVMAIMAAGNRDPERFEDPDTLDLEREDNRHLAFGWAAHFCFGAPLARMEGRVAFRTLLDRLPGLTLAETEPKWRTNLGLRGLTSLRTTIK